MTLHSYRLLLRSRLHSAKGADARRHEKRNTPQTFRRPPDAATVLRVFFRTSRVFPVLCLAGVLSILGGPPPSQAAPIITSISSISTQEVQTITITGSGFGTQAPYTGDADDIVLADLGSAGGYFTAGFVGTFPGGLIPGAPNPSAVDDAVTLVVKSWSDSSIVLGGFSGCWGCVSTWLLYGGDNIEVFVWNAQTGSGPGSISTVVGAESGTPEPSSFALAAMAAAWFVTLGSRKKDSSIGK